MFTFISLITFILFSYLHFILSPLGKGNHRACQPFRQKSDYGSKFALRHQTLDQIYLFVSFKQIWRPSLEILVWQQTAAIPIFYSPIFFTFMYVYYFTLMILLLFFIQMLTFQRNFSHTIFQILYGILICVEGSLPFT